MIFKIRLIIIIIVISAVATDNISAQHKLFIESGKENYNIGRYSSILEDKENILSINEAASDSMRNKYVYYKKENINLRFTNSAFWLRLSVVDTLSSNIVVNQNVSTWLLIKNDPIIEEIRAFYRDLNTGKYIEIKAGSSMPVNSKAIKTNDFIVRFPVQKNVPDTVYLRLKSHLQFITSFNLLTPGEYVNSSIKKYLFHGILFGIFFLLMASNTFLYYSIKEKTYILYVLYILCYTIFIFTYDGYYFEIFGRTFTHDYFILPSAAVTCTGIFGLLLTREFLSTKLFLPWAYKTLKYLTFVGPINFICMFTFSSQILVLVWSASTLGFFVFAFVIAAISLKKGVYISKYYLIASSGLTFGIIAFVSTRNSLFSLPYNFWTQNALHFGVLWEALVFAATVGYRFSFLRAEKEKEKSLIRNQIAADLHDEIGSNLSTIYLQSRLLMKKLETDNNLNEQLNDIANTARKTTDAIRDIVWFINPFHDNSEDLVLRMKELASKMLINIDYKFTSTGGNENIFNQLPDLNKRRHIYLIFKEALNNVIKHSEASEVSILLSIDNKKFIMAVADNGKGFNEEEILPGEGLKNIRNRAALAGAQILINSNGYKGAKMILEVPL